MILSGGISPRQRSTPDPACTPAGRVFRSPPQPYSARHPRRNPTRPALPQAVFCSPPQASPAAFLLIKGNAREINPRHLRLPRALPSTAPPPASLLRPVIPHLPLPAGLSFPASTCLYQNFSPRHSAASPAPCASPLPHALLTLPAYAPLSRRRNLTPPAPRRPPTLPALPQAGFFVPRRKPLTLPPTQKKGLCLYSYHRQRRK